jgi:putative ABC transport system substrate-binding protein
VSSAAISPFEAHAQQAPQIRRVGVLFSTAENDQEGAARVAAFRDELHKLGWIDGSNIRLELRWFGGDPERAKREANELVGLGPEVIVVQSTVGIEAVVKATRKLPTVFVMVGDPVGSGYAASLARPGGNATGFSAFEAAIVGKWLQALKEMAPTVKRVMVLFHPGYDFIWRGAEAAAPALVLEVIKVVCRSPGEIEPAFAAFSSQPNGGVIVAPTPLFMSSRDLIVQLAATHRLPAVYPFRYFSAAGGLMSYGIDVVDIVRRSASYVDRILKGEKPADLPIQQPTKFELVINLGTAKALGLTVPAALLARADEVIE